MILDFRLEHKIKEIYSNLSYYYSVLRVLPEEL